MIDLMYPVILEKYKQGQPSNKNNPGGGMVTKMLSVKSALSQWYITRVIQKWEDVRSSVVLIDPLTPRLAGIDIDQWIAGLSQCASKKILYCSEMEIARLTRRHLFKIVQSVDVITANTQYQSELIENLTAGNVATRHLCDPIDTNLFRPAEQKQPIVFGAGRISRIKNSGFLVEVFKRLTALGIETAYYGSASLWGNSEVLEDSKIERSIKDNVQRFEGSVPRTVLAGLFANASVIIGKTTHDVYSSTHVEALASGCVSLGGGHPLYRERPGIANLQTPKDFVRAVEQVLRGSDIAKRQQTSRDYALEHCSFEAFMRQFQSILQEIV